MLNVTARFARKGNGMLAYVFWHHPRPDADSAHYEAAISSFHDTLRDAGMAGFARSATYRVRGVPWIAVGGNAYEDWYCVDDWAALGALNVAAVGGARKAPHDSVAAAYAAGAGAIYHLRAGEGRFESARFTRWLAKPKGMAYAEFDALLAPLVSAGCAAWRRQMVLGPSPEFCLTGDAHIELPEPLDANDFSGPGVRL